MMRFSPLSPTSKKLFLLIILVSTIVYIDGFGQAQNLNRLLKTATVLEKNHQYEKALQLYKTVYDNDSRSRTAIDGIKKCLHGLQRYDQLIQFLEKILADHQFANSLFVDLAEVYFIQNQSNKAYTIWNAYLRQNASDVNAYRLVATSMIRQRLFEQAINVYEKALSRIRGQYYLHIDIANLYRAQIEYEKASDHLLQYYLKQPKQLNFLRQQILSLSDKVDDSGPLEVSLIRFIQQNPQKKEVQEILAGLYMKEKEYKQAFDIFRKLESDQSAGSYLKKYSMEAFANQAYQAAIAGFETILQKYPSSPIIPDIRFNLARAYAANAFVETDPRTSSNSMKRAISIFQQIIEEDGENFYLKQTYIQLGNIYFNFYFDLDTAEKYYQTYLKTGPADKSFAQVQLTLGDVYLTKNQISDALAVYRTIKDRKFKNRAKFRIAEIHFYTASFEKAKLLYSKILSKIDPQDPLVNDILARRLLLISFDADSLMLRLYAEAELLKFQKKFSMAAEKYLQIKRYNTELYSIAIREASRLYLRLGQSEDAREILLSFIDTVSDDNDMDEIYFILAESEEKLNNTKEARNLYLHIISTYPNSFFVQEARKRAREINSALNEEQT